MGQTMGQMLREWEMIRNNLRSLWYEAQEPCLLCGAAAGPICGTCQEAYFPWDTKRCQQCGKLVKPEVERCADCEEGKGPQGITRAAAWGHYTGLWKDFIWNMKFKSRPLLLRGLAHPVAEAAQRYLPASDGLVPVPLHPERLAERGFNQAEVVASLLHWELGLPLVQGLERVRPTHRQVGLRRGERLENLKGAFIFQGASIQGKELWLIDDVITTGATLEACAEALLEAGARRVYAFALAGGRESQKARE